MRHFNGRSLKTLTLLSIVVPLSLLAAFKVIGILPGPSIVSEMITLEIISREYERPWGLVDFEDRAVSIFDDEINVVQEFLVTRYDQDEFGASVEDLYFNMSSSVSPGYIRGLRISFTADNVSARVNIIDNSEFVRMEGFSIADMRNGVRDSFMALEGTGHPETVSFRVPVYWILSSLGNQTHQLGVVSEIVYFNGSVFKKVVQPFLFRLIGDNNNRFDTADEIHEGFYPRFFLGPGPSGGDPRDYYRINVTRGEAFHVTVDRRAWTWPRSLNPAVLFTVHIYDASRNPVAATESPWDGFQSVDFVVDSSGFWFIEVRNYDGLGFYSLGVNQ